MSKQTEKFYDELSSDYHLIFADWNKAIDRQSIILDTILKKYSKISGKRLLDCSCGIGTQAIGLAQKGYNVTASDLSPKAVQRAETEAKERQLDIKFQVADFMKLHIQVEGIFDIVISCDNSLPHIIRDEDLKVVAKNIYSKLNQDGLFLASIRDYDELLEEKPMSTMPTIKNEGTISFQTWSWEENNVYTTNHFTLEKKGNSYDTRYRDTKYRAYKRDEMSTIFQNVGFKNIQWIMPDESNYYQPIMIAFK